MTGVDGRPEIIIEGANDVNGDWKVCGCVGLCSDTHVIITNKAGRW